MAEEADWRSIKDVLEFSQIPKWGLDTESQFFSLNWFPHPEKNMTTI